MRQPLIILSIEDQDILSSMATSVSDSLYIPSATVVSIVGSSTTGSLREFSSGQDQDGFTPVVFKSQKRQTMVEKQHQEIQLAIQKANEALATGAKKGYNLQYPRRRF